jgi:uncharacterized membrane protein
MNRQVLKIAGSFLAAIAINIITWFVARGYSLHAPSELALHYNPALGLVANLALGKILGREDRFFWYVAAGASLMLNVLLFVGVLLLFIEAGQ